MRHWSVPALGMLAGWALAAPAAESDLYPPYQKNHWAFQKVIRPAVPSVQPGAWVRNSIDAFILDRLEQVKLAPSPPADPATLLRRASLDLTGVPPSPEEIRSFLTDTSPDAFEKAVDRLLDSPRYGERWARHWLDLARYSESEGFKSDQTRPDAWRYRDYVIRSLNEDKPYDRFVQEQIAGDEIWPEDFQAHIATAFNRHYPDEYNARNLMQRRQEILHDMTATVGAVFSGLTYGCAQCHDHKFDPISQADYYRLQAFFAAVRADDRIPLLTPQEAASHHRQLAVWEEKTEHLRREMGELEAEPRRAILDDFTEKYPDEIREVLRMPAQQRSPYQWLMFYKAQPYLDPESYLYQAPLSSVVRKMKPEQRKRWEQLKAELATFESLHPGQIPTAMGIRDGGAEAPPTFVLRGGAYDTPETEVQPGFLTLLSPDPVSIQPPAGLNSTGRRTALARWLTSPGNPLTARVMVNRIWHYHFGKGLVQTPSNFGLSGDLPTHPELLDWLASEFVERGWSLKAMHRLIMASNTYRQASVPRPEAAAVDPKNDYLWRYSPRRLEGEVIRDAALAVSGLLNTRMGGPSVFPELPSGLDPQGAWKVSPDPMERNRRSIYVFVRRNLRYPMFQVLDMPDTHESCPARVTTTSPLQALTMLNDEVVIEWARAFASRLLLSSPDPRTQVRTAYALAYQRDPQAEEVEAVLGFLEQQRLLLGQRLERGESVLLPPLRPHDSDPAQAAALVDFCQMVLNSNEFVYVH